MPGWGPYVEETAYQNFIANYVDEPEVSGSRLFHLSLMSTSLHRSILASLSMMPLSEPKHGVHLVMPCQVPVLSSAQDMRLFEKMALATFRKERSKVFPLALSARHY